MPPESGRCRALITAFYYDPKSKQCKTFFYGGCGGNANRFPSKNECEKACMTKSVADVVIPSVISAVIM
ncbi:unnamed protein product [Trichobilharzia regenti]|nr:unnamed protein product [Trichobilharzia regenti]